MKKMINLMLVIALLLVSTTTALGAQYGGNVTCLELGYPYSSARIDSFEIGVNNYVYAPGFGTITWSTDGTYVNWSATFFISAVIVKGSNDANVYEYDPAVKSGTGLHAPVNASGSPAELSNITFCWDEQPDLGQWCSPGYWRQEHHLGSWAATGISPDEYYNDYFDPDLSGNPTLWEVLQSPKTYGGAAFNNVGDLLSAAHPDVDFQGERVEDSCPLGRAP
jgi:hypothetical protein